MSKKLNIGIIGYGHLGKIHEKCVRLIPEYNLVGIYDINKFTLTKAQEKGLSTFDKVEDLLQKVDVIDIVTPTPSHFKYAKKAIEAGKHIFIEKPMTFTLEEAIELQRLVNESNLKLQVGHVERFNPAFLSLKDIEIDPLFVEGHRLAPFNPRGTDVSVVLDLMIHDLDLILNLIKSEPVDVKSHGVSIVSQSHDICNARIEFKNGSVANLTASRISLKQMRKLRLFQSDAYISMDFLDKKSEIVRLFNEGDQKLNTELPQFPLDTAKGKKIIQVNLPEVKEVNAIREELFSFYQSIVNNERPTVNVIDGRKALELAYWIMKASKQPNE